MAPFSFVLEAMVKVIFNACAITKDKNYVKIIIESDYKILMDVVLGLVYEVTSFVEVVYNHEQIII